MIESKGETEERRERGRREREGGRRERESNERVFRKLKKSSSRKKRKIQFSAAIEIHNLFLLPPSPSSSSAFVVFQVSTLVRASLSLAERAQLIVCNRRARDGSRRRPSETARGGSADARTCSLSTVELSFLFRAPRRRRRGSPASKFARRSSLRFGLLALFASANRRGVSTPRDRRAHKGRRREEDVFRGTRRTRNRSERFQGAQPSKHRKAI